MKIDFIFPLRKTFPGTQFLLQQCYILIPYPCKEQKHLLQQTANATSWSTKFSFSLSAQIVQNNIWFKILQSINNGMESTVVTGGVATVGCIIIFKFKWFFPQYCLRPWTLKHVNNSVNSPLDFTAVIHTSEILHMHQWWSTRACVM